MKVVVCSLAAGEDYRRLMEPCIASHRAYCAFHDYEYIYETRQLDLRRPPAWSKVRLMQRILEEDKPDILAWLDADTIITNNQIEISSVMALVDEDKDLLLSRDRNNLNTGVMFARGTEWTRNFLKRVYRQRRFINHRWWEQMAIIHLFTKKKKVREKIAVLGASHQYLLNATPGCWTETSFLVHFAGARNKESSVAEWIGRRNGFKYVDLTEMEFVGSVE